MNIKGRGHTTDERLLITEINIQLHYTPFFHAPEADVLIGWNRLRLGLIHYFCVTFTEPGLQTKFILRGKKEQTGRVPYEAFLWDFIFNQLKLLLIYVAQI